MEQRYIQQLTIDWSKISPYSYLRKIPALQFKDSIKFNKNITFFVGENGTGKSTLLEAIAVAEEARSQNMKSELITNVSHDLKTPLTAIITYVDLLKKEEITEEERKSYIETLDMKSQRLKVLKEAVLALPSQRVLRNCRMDSLK